MVRVPAYGPGEVVTSGGQTVSPEDFAFATRFFQSPGNDPDTTAESRESQDTGPSGTPQSMRGGVPVWAWLLAGVALVAFVFGGNR